MIDRFAFGRRPVAGLSLMFLTSLTLFGCSADDGSIAASAGTQQAGASTTGQVPDPGAGSGADSLPPGDVASTVATSDGASAPVATDGMPLLQQALAALASGFRFDTTVTVDGVDIIVASGDRVGDSTRLTIWADGGSVAYVITPAASWVFPEGGEWQALDTAPSSTDPVAALRDASAVSAIATDAANSELSITVARTAIGIPGTGDATVQASVTNGLLTRLRYDTVVSGGTASTASSSASVISVLGPLVDTSPVVAPI